MIFAKIMGLISPHNITEKKFSDPETFVLKG
jgi:hypothetical protein